MQDQDDDKIETVQNNVPIAVKRPPGRPKKTTGCTTIYSAKKGIIVLPGDDNHHIEFSYNKPTNFKKIWLFLKQMAIEKVQMVFSKDHIKILCVDHHKKNNIQIKIDCTNVTSYFCQEDLDIGLSCKNLGMVLSTIDNKTHNNILFLSIKDDIQKNIHVILKNAEEDVEDSHKIELIGEYDRMSDLDKFDDDDYKIKFQLKGNYFKSLVTNVKTFTDQVAIRQDDPNDNLYFEYVEHEKKIKSNTCLKNKKAIKLISNLKEDESFHIDVKIDYIKPISNTVLSDDIIIYADENKPLKFIINLDESIQIVILTNIIDNRSKV
jgi:hypothetical protein